MYILGISAFYHDSAASYLDGEIIGCTRRTFYAKKHDQSFPDKCY